MANKESADGSGESISCGLSNTRLALVTSLHQAFGKSAGPWDETDGGQENLEDEPLPSPRLELYLRSEF